MGIIKKLTHLAKHDPEAAATISAELDYLFTALGSTVDPTTLPKQHSDWIKYLVDCFMQTYLAVEKIQAWLITIDDKAERISHAYTFECYLKQIGYLDENLEYDDLLQPNKAQDNGQTSLPETTAEKTVST